ncbi:malto-oligosyltrehalose synthase [Streptomyces sp. NPDC054796]
MTPPAPYGPPAPDAPVSTYRLQLQPEFPFAAAEEAVPHLAALGITHLHLSPVLTSVPGSTHGYDVTDHTRVRAELGGEDGLRALSATARAHGLGLVLDVVPNHMAVPADTRLNLPLWEVLREGRESPYARWFDVDWDAGDGRVLLPVLGGPLSEEASHLRVVPGAGTGIGAGAEAEAEAAAEAEAEAGARAVLRYWDRVFPLREGTEGLPLPELLDAQHYRLAWWRLARTELNYRRFFTISDLIGVRVEDPEVFEATHAKVLQLLREGVAEGLRVDHPDGLAEPGGYLLRLHEATGGRWTVVEKILGAEETLPADWPVAGTTGYDALRHIDGVFTDPRGHGELLAVYRDFTRAAPHSGGDWDATVRRAALQVVTRELAAETDRLTRTALRVCAAAPGLALRDHSAVALRAALHQTLVRLPVYRPYVTPGATAGAAPGAATAATPGAAQGAPVRETDAAMLEAAAEGARGACRTPEEERAVDLIRDLALGRLGEGPGQRDFAARFAQVSSALRAKSVEDAAFYRYIPLLSACEVGGSPGAPAVAPDAFHAYCARLQRDWPTTATALSTHDTKRSADVRAALATLTECPGRWARFLEDTRITGATDRAPDRHTAWAAWQTAVGLGGVPGSPEGTGRLARALLKHVREAGLRTTWTEPDAGYEEAVTRFVDGIGGGEPGAGGSARSAVAELTAALGPYVRANVLGAALLHLTMPGVPDLYQGTERRYAALVDPDNRDPAHVEPLTHADGGTEADAAADAAGVDVGREKLRLTVAALRLRRAHPEWFLDTGSYEPLHAEGPAAEHCLAFARGGSVVAAVTRLALRLEEGGGWRGTELPLPEGTWRDLLSGRTARGRRPVGALFAGAPVALLVREDAGEA